MTSRDHIFSRYAIAVAYAGFSVLAIVGTVELLNLRGGFGPLIVMVVIFPVPFMHLLLRARCPRCRYPFAYLGFVRLKWGARRKRFDHCPHCGLALDTPVDQVRATE